MTAGDGESPEEFHALVEGLERCYEPVGAMEEIFVQTIATCVWRKARVMRAENGEIRKQLDTLSIDRALRSSDKANFGLALSEMDIYWYSAENQSDQKVSTMDRWSAMQVAQSNLREHRSGLAYLNALLEIAKSEIASDGHMSEKIRKKILGRSAFQTTSSPLPVALAVPQNQKWKTNHPNRVRIRKLRQNVPLALPISTFSSIGLAHSRNTC